MASVHALPAFLALTPVQLGQLQEYGEQIQAINRRHNLVSEASADAFWERHVLHSLALAYRPFPSGAAVVDWGTGGGLPGVPLAIAFPGVQFHLVDAVEKKVRSVRAVVRRLGLPNVEVHHVRAEVWREPVHYSVSRATAPLETLWQWTLPVLTLLDDRPEGSWDQGLVCLKGGDLREEIHALRAADASVQVRQIPLEPLLNLPYFGAKMMLHVGRAEQGE